MKGKILDYNIQDSKGAISGNDGNRYYFENSEWKGNVSPKVNQVVDFETDGQNAKSIYLVKTSGIELSDINSDEKIGALKDKLNTIKNNGMQNKFGFIISLIMVVFIFVPIIKLNMGFNIVELSVIDYTLGFVGLVSSLVSAFLFYSGGKQLYTRVAVAVTSIINLLFIIDVVSAINSMVAFVGSRRLNFFDALFQTANFGTALFLAVMVLYAFSALKKNYVFVK
ncbi:hypothetical protein [Aliarcobacter cibarius]|uniref:hypothetical protein n=1 Tax=Aliarcobacter cibarius TaxID=255507 RepID=UPI0010FD7483|nr:hypothetical protein [Aliarcobacter cibarius]TLT02326.1 hypothetical protein FE248_10715 [Aliarcobacter cibarius]